MIRRLFDRLLCKLGHCRRCRIYDDGVSIGGKCESCGKLHGVMTHEEIRACLTPGAVPLPDMRERGAAELPTARVVR